MLGEFETRSKDMCDPAKEFAPINSLGLTDKTKEEGRVFLKGIIDREIQRMQGQIQPVKKWEFFFKFKNSLGEKYGFTNLRGTENTVAVEMIWSVFE